MSASIRELTMNTKSILHQIKNKSISSTFIIVVFAFFALSTQVASAAKIIVLSGNLNFGSVNVGSSAQRILTISNAGNATLQVDSITLPAGFTSDLVAQTHVNSGNTLDVTISFSPTAVQ